MGDMASASYIDELTCPICLCLFIDPVSLLCGHSFCRQCITDCLRLQMKCPQCRSDILTAERDLPTNYTLKSMAKQAREDEKKMEGHHKKRGETDQLCPEHEEQLKLFCETDQQLVCLICRDGETHAGHTFKPIKEAAMSRRRELEEAIQFLSGDNSAIDHMTKQQEVEMTKTRKKSHLLMTQISSQFEEMHQFLKQREEEIKRELLEKEKKALEEMKANLYLAPSERREMEMKIRSSQDIPEPECFLQWWTGGGGAEIEDLKKRNKIPPPPSADQGEHPFTPRADDLQVIPESLSLGPYETHLQFFVWKEMMQVVKPLPERLKLQTQSGCLSVSHDGRSVLCRSANSARMVSSPRRAHPSNVFPSGRQDDHRDYAVSEGKFIAGQHYWEAEVGRADHWTLGVTENTLDREVARFRNIRQVLDQGLERMCLEYNDKQYTICAMGQRTNITLREEPRKIGLYLDCAAKELSFYNADDMKLIHTMGCDWKDPTKSAYVDIGECSGIDSDPLTLCWY